MTHVPQAQTADRRVPAVLSVAMFMIGTASLCILGVGPALTQDLNLDPSAAGWLVMVFSATFALAAPLAQFVLGGRLAPRRLILWGSGLMAGAMIWAALTPGLHGLLASRFLAAFGGAVIAPTAAALVVALAPAERRGAFLAILFTGFTLATVLGVPFATWLAFQLGWRGVMVVIAGLAVIVWALVYYIVPDRPPAAARAHQSSLMPAPRTLALLLTTMGMLAAQFTLYALMGEVLGQRHGVSDDGLPLAILLFGIMGFAGNLAAGLLSDRLGPARVVWISFAGLGVMMLALLPPVGPLAAALLLSGCAFAGTLFSTPQQGRLVDDIAPERHGLVMALNSSASYLGIALGSGLASALAPAAGLGALPLAGLGVLTVALLCNIAVARVRSQGVIPDT